MNDTFLRLYFEGITGNLPFFFSVTVLHDWRNSCRTQLIEMTGLEPGADVTYHKTTFKGEVYYPRFLIANLEDKY